MTFDHLAKTAENPGIRTEPTDVYLGLGVDGDIVWDPERASNMLIVGYAGVGKTVFLENLRAQICNLPREWEVLSVDTRKLENEAYVRGELGAIVPAGLRAATLALRRAHDVIVERHERMLAENVTKFSDLSEELPRVAVVIDEVAGVFSKTAIKFKSKDINHLTVDTNLELMKLIYRTGAAAGVHLILAMQRPDHEVLNYDRREDFPCRIVLGRTDKLVSQLALGNDAAAMIPDVQGRGYIQINNSGQVLQSYSMLNR